MDQSRKRPPVIGRILGVIFGLSWLAWLIQDILGRRRGRVEGHLHADLVGYSGMVLALLAPVLSHRNRFFGRLPHHPAQKALAGTGVALSWAGLGLSSAGVGAGPLSPALLFRTGLALMLESPFVFLVSVLPTSVPLIRRLLGR